MLAKIFSIFLFFVIRASYPYPPPERPASYTLPGSATFSISDLFSCHSAIKELQGIILLIRIVQSYQSAAVIHLRQALIPDTV